MLDSPNYIFKEKLSASPILQALGLIFCLIGVGFMSSSIPLGLVVVLLSILFFLPKRIREVDIKNQRYQEGLTFGQNINGEWKEFPKGINYISILGAKKVFKARNSLAVPAASATNTYKEYVVSLVYNKRSRFEVSTFEGMDKAIEMAKSTAYYMKKDILIVEPGNKRWIRFEE